MTEDYPIEKVRSEDVPSDQIGQATGVVDARNRGLTLYWTGRPCKRNHYDYRYAASGSCRECAREAGRAKAKGYGKRGRPVSISADYAFLPKPLRAVEDARVEHGIGMRALSRRIGRHEDFYSGLLHRAIMRGAVPSLTHHDATNIEAALFLVPGTLSTVLP
jgi:hypothetical protein